jgi:hypothetical protein
VHHQDLWTTCRDKRKSVLIVAGTPYSRIVASQIARTWLRSIAVAFTNLRVMRVVADIDP